MVLVSIKSAESDVEYRQAILNLINLQRVLTSCRYTCRILVAAIDSCSDNFVDLITERIMLKEFILSFMAEKFASYILIGAIMRNHQPTVDAFG